MSLASLILFRSFTCVAVGSWRALAGIGLSMVALVIIFGVFCTLGVGIAICTLGAGVAFITIGAGVAILTLGVGVAICGLGFGCCSAGGLDDGSKVTCLAVSSLVVVVGI